MVVEEDRFPDSFRKLRHLAPDPVPQLSRVQVVLGGLGGRGTVDAERRQLSIPEVLASAVPHDAREPRAERGGIPERGELAKGEEERLLHHVVESGRGHTGREGYRVRAPLVPQDERLAGVGLLL